MNWVTIFRILLFSTASFLVISSRLAFFDDYYKALPVCSDLESKKLLLFISGYLITAIYLPIENEIFKYKLRARNKLKKYEVIIFREVHRKLLNNIFNVSDFNNANFSLYVPKRNRNYYLLKWIQWRESLSKTKKASIRLVITYKYYRVQDLHKELAEELQFIVNPKNQSQGLVGLAYLERGIGIKTPANRRNPNYAQFQNRMSTFQRQTLSPYPFMITIPVIDSNNNVKAIIAVDSKVSITVNTRQIKSQADNLMLFGREFVKELKPLVRKRW